ncbi:MAG: 50S ribosomal protein L11 methyltransferase [Thermoanaerobaculia bacterium]
MFGYHRDLLSDQVRIDAYRAALNATVRPGDVVVDVGTGTGILAFLACQAGARHVYAIEQQHTADGAALLARQLGFADRITVLHGRSTEVELPERADVLVSETIGPLVFNEGWLGIVIDARERLLAPGARLIPSVVDVWIAPVEVPKVYAEQLDWWSTPRHGFDFSLLRMFEANALHSANIDRESLLASPATMMSLRAAEVSDPVQHGSAAFVADRDGTLHGFAIGFTATLADGITLTNAWGPATTWQQGLLLVEQPLAVSAGTPITVQLQVDAAGVWFWRGSAAEATFDQTTFLSRPPCMLAKRNV